MNDEKLILLVQANECLYNKYCIGYKLGQKKKSVWQQISVEMEVPEEMVVKRWSCLRDRYARERRIENLPSGSGAKTKSQWPLMESMAFIDKFINPRATRCSFNIVEDNSSLSSSPSPLLSSPVLSSALIEPEITFRPIESTPTTPEMPTQNLQTPPVVQKRKRSERADDESFSEALGAFKKLCESRSEKQKEEGKDPLYGFGQMIVATIRSMNPTKQLKAMQRVTSLVMEMKMEPE